MDDLIRHEQQFTPGRYNAAYFEHSYLAEQSGAVLAEARDLYVQGDVLYYRSTQGDQRVGAIYRRVSDEYMDPLCFEPGSLIGIPNLMAAYRAGNVAVLNAFGNGAADDKGIYFFVPKMIRYYLGEEPILANAPTYLPIEPDGQAYILDHLDTLVVMDQGQRVERKADLRAFVLSGAGETLVWPSGLTRFSRNPDSFIVNSSQGGGFKDTWILSR